MNEQRLLGQVQEDPGVAPVKLAEELERGRTTIAEHLRDLGRYIY